MEWVYQMVSRTDEETMRFLNDVIVLNVQANPDGQELVANWYMREKDPLKRSMNGQGHRVDRWRAARHRNRGLAAAYGVGLPDGQPHRRRDHALSQRRDRALGPGQPRRPGACRQLVHARKGPPQAPHVRPAPPRSEEHTS